MSPSLASSVRVSSLDAACAASMSSATRSASRAPPHAVSTIARSSRRFGAKMPGVSTKMTCEGPTIAMPRTSERVVCTLRLTIETLVPTSRLTRVDLPALVAPMMATKPQRVASSGSIALPPSTRPRGPGSPSQPPARPRAALRPSPRCRLAARRPSPPPRSTVRGRDRGARRSHRPGRRAPLPCAHSCSVVLASRQRAVASSSMRPCQSSRMKRRAASMPPSR